ncbi:hypothetical protein POX_c03735 [Penicillium oxalicum]|uniref:hypothetical protein n=1 Tax=Penicillium oxalicum TaxID=69781 RepID=UPI0020B788D7|nr:hypothetical protein POX_c03735 [Penicillium oxalicum]KAI2790884.1 hypothetical protein POX_c03735 [Penicillium oxalicum]
MASSSLIGRGIYPQLRPAFESRQDINPTLMMSWWATALSLVIIFVRLCGRYIRIERFFPEDKVVMWSVIPLVLRMVIVHFVLVLGTNNTQTVGLTPAQVRDRMLGSKLVLVARIFYAVYIWTAKLTVCEFFKRVTGMVWRRSVAYFLRFIHFFLASTLVAVVIATLAECHPFNHYWQVIPDPGPRCRSGYAQLITMGACDVVTDLLLVAFPVPIILMAQIPIKRKLALVTLFCLSFILVGITCFRVPSVIWRRGAQPYRSLVASLEILAATAVSNLVVIGSFVRDRGVKKLKYKPTQGSASVTESLDHSYVRRQTVMQHQWGSDCDLAGDLGIRLDPKLYSSAPGMSIPPGPSPKATVSDDDRISSADSFDIKASPREYLPTSESPRDTRLPSPDFTPFSHRVSFFDVGGLLNRESPLQTPSRPPLLTRHTIAPSTTTAPVAPTRHRRGSRAFLEDLGVVQPRTTATPPVSARLSCPPSLRTMSPSELLSHSPRPHQSSRDTAPDLEVELQDVGGLLSRSTYRG